MIPVVDGHHHIWRQADLPWLMGPMQPRIFGPYEPIRRDYPIEEFRADLDGLGVVKSVYVQTNWSPEAYEEEAAWVQQTADRTGWPHAIVAYADIGADDVRPQLDRLSRYLLVRGARMQLHWHENPEYRFASRPDLVADSRIQPQRRLVRRLWLELRPAGVCAANGRRGRSCRVLPEGHLRPSARGYARRPVDRRTRRMACRYGAPRGVPERDDQAFGSRHLRASQRSRRMSPKSFARLCACSAPERCLFGSNFPIEKLWTSYAELCRLTGTP